MWKSLHLQGKTNVSRNQGMNTQKTVESQADFHVMTLVLIMENSNSRKLISTVASDVEEGSSGSDGLGQRGVSFRGTGRV
jgi:hypothetical protein